MTRLATSTEPLAVRNARSSALTMFRANNSAEDAHRDIPEPEPNPEPNPAPDGAVTARGSKLSPADWDVLFNAVTARLQACGGSDMPTNLPEHLLGASASMQTTVRECVEALKRLQVDLTQERQQRHRPE